ncbi:MAG: hypothetical protein KJO18_03275, partial [Acidimicrobiia bacterium]|nr:hypothetical protein [Acidimicrobiia bacterium]
MLRRLQLRHRMLLLPLAAALGFLAVLYFVSTSGRNYDSVISQIESGYFPALQLSHDLEGSLATIRQGFDEAAVALSTEVLDENDARRQQMLATLTAGQSNSTLDEGMAAAVTREFEQYYALTRQTTVRMIEEGATESILDDLDETTKAYQRVEKQIAEWSKLQADAMEQAIARVREGSQQAVWRPSVVVAATLAVLLILSFLILR